MNKERHALKFNYYEYVSLSPLEKIFYIPRCQTCHRKDVYLNFHSGVTNNHRLTASYHYFVPPHKKYPAKGMCEICYAWCDECRNNFRAHFINKIKQGWHAFCSVWVFIFGRGWSK